MKLINALFARGMGGIEQAFVDYGRALSLQGHDVLQLVHPDAAIIPLLKKHGLRYVPVSNFGQWDVFASKRLRTIVKNAQAELAIAHGNRAISLLGSACNKHCPLIGVAHNYNLKRFPKLDGALTVTKGLKQHLISQGMKEDNIFHIPNMIALPDPLPGAHKMTYPPVIGCIGRFVEKKGFDVLVSALNILHKQGMDFRAILAGDGPVHGAVQKQVQSLGLQKKISLPGWVSDPSSFYNDISLFCLPSRHEPFGIVLLEAMAHGLPVISTDSEGPTELLTNRFNALIVPRDDANALAEGLIELISAQEVAQSIAQKGQESVIEHYCLPRVAPKLSAAVTRLHHLWQETHA